MTLPEHIGPYTILSRLGRGGMGSVYKVIMPDFETIAALKILDPFEATLEIFGKEKIAEMFTDESRIMGTIKSPYVVKILDSGADELGVPYFVMEFYCNNLGAVISEHYHIERLTRVVAPDRVMEYGLELLEGLTCLHGKGIIHRDIKPYNILISDQGTIKLCDFGLSRLRGETPAAPTGMRVGSPYYTAPEQVHDPECADERADLYSVGVLLYRMLTGELPSMKHFSLSMVNVLFDRQWDRFFAKALNLQRENRFQNCSEMREALHALHIHWENRKAEACERMDTVTATGDERTILRLKPVRVAGRNARDVFDATELFQPRHKVDNRFSLTANDDVVFDRSTGLYWDRSGSAELYSWQQAAEYVLSLNEQGYGGHRHWRLPTVNELFSISQGGLEVDSLCGQQFIKQTRNNYWSCDWRSDGTAWYVNTLMAYADWQDATCAYSVRAVTGRDN